MPHPVGHPTLTPALLPPRSAMLRWIRTLGVTALLIIGLAVLAWLLLGRPPEPPPPLVERFAVSHNAVQIAAQDQAWKYIQFHTAQLGKPLDPLPVPGRIAVDESRATRVMAPLSGRIEKVEVNLGQVVAEGDLIAVVRSGALVDLQAEQRLAESALQAQSRNLQRIRSLVEAEAAPAKDLVFAQRELEQAKVGLEAAQLKRRSLRVREEGPGIYELIAPRGGVVLRRDVAVGEEVGPDRTEPLALIADLSEVTAIASVPEAETAELTVGMPAQVTMTGTGHQFAATIDRISAVVDPERRTVDVRLRLANPKGELRPNAWIKVGFPAVGPQRVLVPSAAVVTDDQQAVVFVRKGERMERRLVTRGRQRDGWSEIVQGLAPGEEVAGQGALLLLNAIDLQR